jgi:hypothetical protein
MVSGPARAYGSGVMTSQPTPSALVMSSACDAHDVAHRRRSDAVIGLCKL